MKRILYLSRGGCIGGSQRQLYYLLAGLRSVYEPVVVCNKGGLFVDRLRLGGIGVEVLPLRPWRKLPAAFYRYADSRRLVEFARQCRPDMVHSSDLWLANYMHRVADKLQIPSVLHVRAPVGPDKVRKYNFGKADSIIAISPRIKQNLISAGIGEEKITVINDAVDFDDFRPQEPSVNILKQHFSLDGQIAIGIAGRIDPCKRQFDFLRAVEQLVCGSSPHAVFFIIGETHSEDYFEELKKFIANNKLDKRVFFTGRREDMPQVLSSLDILVSLSGGSVMFEAMACGKPVISAGFSTKESSVHIQDGFTGLLISSKETRELVAAMDRLINNPQLRAQIGKNARKWAEDKFSYLDMAAKTHQLYRQLVD